MIIVYEVPNLTSGVFAQGGEGLIFQAPPAYASNCDGNRVRALAIKKQKKSDNCERTISGVRMSVGDIGYSSVTAVGGGRTRAHR